MPDINELPQSSASFERIVLYEESVDFDSLVNMAINEVTTSFDLLEEPEGDVAPFALTAEGPEIYLVLWQIDEELVDKFLTHVVPPTLAARDAHIAALFLTTYLTDPDGERTETALLSVLETDGQTAREGAFAADIMRSEDSGPTLGEWGMIATRLAPAVGRPLYMGLLGEFEGQE